MLSIEVFPAEKSCEQGCSTCPLARKDKAMRATHIDPHVQKTFSILENVLRKKKIRYDLHTTSAIELFPKVAHPKLIYMARFETDKYTIGINGNARHFSEKIKALLVKTKINPKVIGFSIVPKYPIVSAEDAQTIKQILDELHSWYVTKYKKIDVTIRSNLIKPALFHEVSFGLFEGDKNHIDSLLKTYGTIYKNELRSPLGQDEHLKVYFNEYRTQTKSNEIILSNRVITTKHTDNEVEANVNQALKLYPYTLNDADIAITPRGVMIMHSSTVIHNPVLWVSHSDFRKTLFRELKKPNFSLLSFVQNIIRHNAIMYELILKHKNDNHKTTSEYWMASFEVNRENTVKQLEKSRHK